MDVDWRRVWFESKAWVEVELGVSQDLLHVHVDLFIFLSFAVVLRKRRHGVYLAWGILALLQAVNEALDARDWINWVGVVNWRETVKDMAITLF